MKSAPEGIAGIALTSDPTWIMALLLFKEALSGEMIIDKEIDIAYLVPK